MRGDNPERSMPTLFRFLFTIGVIVGLVYAGLFALAIFVEPRERDVTVRIPSERLNPAQTPPAAPATPGTGSP